MRYLKTFMFICFVLGTLIRSGISQETQEQQLFQLVDGEIYLVGTFLDLSTIEITSSSGKLSLGTVDTGVKVAEPFKSGAAILVDEPDIVAYGVLGAFNRIDIEGETPTSIRYAAPLSVARTDLSVSIGVIGTPQPVAVGSRDELIGNGVTLDDGILTFIGDFQQLAGVEATSPGGHLSLEALALEGSTLFSAFDNQVLQNNENRISVSAVNSVTFDGLTPTGIFFDGDEEAFAAAGIQVLVGLGGAPPVPLRNAHVPEPAAISLSILALMGTLAFRQRRRESDSTLASCNGGGYEEGWSWR